EFAVLFSGATLEDAVFHAEKLRRNIEQDVFVVRGPSRSVRKREERRATAKVPRRRRQSAVESSVTVSIGVAAAQPDTHDPNEVIKAADRALYSAKDLGRNRVEAAESSKRKKTALTAN